MQSYSGLDVVFDDITESNINSLCIQVDGGSIHN